MHSEYRRLGCKHLQLGTSTYLYQTIYASTHNLYLICIHGTQSGPLGGDAQIAALMCMEDLGALIFFVDPLSAHRK